MCSIALNPDESGITDQRDNMSYGRASGVNRTIRSNTPGLVGTSATDLVTTPR